MNARERVLGALHFKKIDYIPVTTNKEPMGPRLIGRDYNQELFADADALAKAEMEIWERVPDDELLLCGTPAIQMALGCKLAWPGDDHPQYGEAIVHNRSEAEELPVPDPDKDEYEQALIEAVRQLKKWKGDELPIKVVMHGAFNILSRIVGPENMLQWMLKDTESVRILCDKITDAQIAFAGKLQEAGTDIIDTRDAMSSPSCISPKMFREIALPYHRKEMVAYKELGLHTILHICGYEYPILDQLQFTGADAFYFTELVDVAVAQKIFFRRFAVTGGIDPTNILYIGTPKTVDAEVKRIFQSLKHKSGFILQPGCGLSPNIPIENLKAMLDASRRYSELAGHAA